MNRRLLSIALAVACAHGLVLWALQSGFMRPQAKAVEAPPVVMHATLLEAPQPEANSVAASEPSPPIRPTAQTPPKRALATRQNELPSPQPAPSPAPVLAVNPKATDPSEPTTSVSSASNPTSSVAASPLSASDPAPPATSKPSSTPSSPPGPPKIELPSSHASYLNNPKAPYPPLSKRLGEQGLVVVRVLIGTDGTASQATIQSSSNYERLDRTAVETVLKWRFVPGKRAGLPEAMWFNVPLSFVLE